MKLFLIFKKKVNEIGWSLNKNVKDIWFKDKMDYFKFYGRDIETLLAKKRNYLMIMMERLLIKFNYILFS